MKLKFELQRLQIEHLLRILQHVYTNVWNTQPEDDKIFFYFDDENMVIYPGERCGFDRVFSRIHIHNLTSNVHG